MIIIAIGSDGTYEMKLLSWRQMMLQHGDSVSNVATVTRSSLFSEGDDSVVVSVARGDRRFGLKYQVKTDPELRTPEIN